MRILRLNSPEWSYILVGSMSAVVMGASFPAFAIIFGEFYGVSYKKCCLCDIHLLYEISLIILT